MKDNQNINRHIATRVRQLRSSRGLSLDALAAKCGVSRSMISAVERGESSPTAVVLEKLAAGLNVTLPSLFDPPSTESLTNPVARQKDQPVWRDPATGYVRRNVSPPGVPQPMQIVEVEFPPGERVAFETNGREVSVYQQIWVLEGKIELSLGNECHKLCAGDCIAMCLEGPIIFHNSTRKPARYAVVITNEMQTRGRR